MMKTDTRHPLTQDEADSRAVLEHAFKGTPVDPEVSQRVRERADKVREDLRSRGVQINTLELLRDSRDEI